MTFFFLNNTKALIDSLDTTLLMSNCHQLFLCEVCNVVKSYLRARRADNKNWRVSESPILRLIWS